MLQCDLCLERCLVPRDKEQNRRHQVECIRARVQEIEEAFARQQLREKTCDICLEVVTEKMPITSRRFGILPNCKHTFCVECIKTWRNTADYIDSVKKGCPTCRVESKFYCPSTVWVETDRDKKALFARNRAQRKKIDCKFYKRGTGVCPHGDRCFYRHSS